MSADYIIREAVPQDADRIVAYMRAIADEPDNGISFASANEFPYSPEDEAQIIADYAQAPTSLFLVAEAAGAIISVANCRAGNRGYRHTVELGITVRRDRRDQGVGTAMMRHIVSWAQANPLIHRLELQVFPDNQRAIHVYEKIGFAHEGVRRQSFCKAGQFLDLVMMGMVFDREGA